MAGFYIYNNVGIAFRTFASGILLGVGSVLILVCNGLFLGGMAAHIANAGHADVLFHRHAGVIAGLLTHAGQSVEQRAFPGIGITDDRDADRRLSAYGNLVGRYMGD